jgi:hypothetical protein
MGHGALVLSWQNPIAGQRAIIRAATRMILFRFVGITTPFGYDSIQAYPFVGFLLKCFPL